MREVEIIERMITPSLESMGFRLVRLSFGGGNRPTLQIMAEPADGSAMTVDHCADISRTVSALLDVEDPIKLPYMLEVTSPGIDRPLITREDFARFAGFDAKFETERPIDGRKRFKGVIAAVDAEDRVPVTDEKGATAAVPFSEIRKAKLILTDALLKAFAPQHPSGDEPEENTAA
ncbi:ribosome maturation factor RimP [Aliidongia dinghuensis]|uniref:Ribosome maturation factor RimP n=1 Tax=Aliidongia dinghuensis TaxID=1867774 RepID=A0A8J3E192_9PROT|nr:ribosome maturation factor RimP [Aliidongia dinghuensis]GGE99617.1 ribosome maturation factor RimP [Aliidongia dinghuensis]